MSKLEKYKYELCYFIYKIGYQYIKNYTGLLN